MLETSRKDHDRTPPFDRAGLVVRIQNGQCRPSCISKDVWPFNERMQKSICQETSCGDRPRESLVKRVFARFGGIKNDMANAGSLINAVRRRAAKARPSPARPIPTGTPASSLSTQTMPGGTRSRASVAPITAAQERGPPASPPAPRIPRPCGRDAPRRVHPPHYGRAGARPSRLVAPHYGHDGAWPSRRRATRKGLGSDPNAANLRRCRAFPET